MDPRSVLLFCRDELRRRADAGGAYAWRWRFKLNAVGLCLALAELRAPRAAPPLTEAEREFVIRYHPMLREHETIPSASELTPDASWVREIHDRADRYAMASRGIR